MRSDWWKFNECMMSGTRSPVKYIRRGEEGVRATDLGPSENQARCSRFSDSHSKTFHMRTPLFSGHFYWSRECPLTGGLLVICITLHLLEFCLAISL